MAACLRAGSPTSRSPSLVNATNEGNALPEDTPAPSADGMIVGLPPSITEAAELEVPRSIPMTLAILFSFTALPRATSWSLPALPSAALPASLAELHRARGSSAFLPPGKTTIQLQLL